MLATKPGALRSGAPFQDWELAPALSRLRRKLGAGDDADRPFVRVLAAVLDDGLEAMEVAVREALLVGVTSDDVICRSPARAVSCSSTWSASSTSRPRSSSRRS